MTARKLNRFLAWVMVMGLSMAAESKDLIIAPSMDPHRPQGSSGSHYDQDYLKFSRAGEGIDLHFLRELNEKAAKLWEKILLLSDGDVEKARDAFQFARFPVSLTAEIKTLHREVWDYLASSAFLDGLQEGDARLPSIHPLLAQVFLDCLVRHEIFHGLDRGLKHKKINADDRRRLVNLLIFYVQYLPLTSFDELGLWPTYAAKALSDLHDTSLANSLLAWGPVDGFTNRYSHSQHSLIWLTGEIRRLQADSKAQLFCLPLWDGEKDVNGLSQDVYRVLRRISRLYLL